LQHYSKGPLPWLDDLNHDGRAEFILWDSFPLHGEASMAEYVLVAWVYALDSPDTLTIDWELTRSLAKTLAMEYRSPVDANRGPLRKLRGLAADALECFASKGCSVAP
jgi:hypothetical protein